MGTYDRIKKLCKERKITISKLEEDLGFKSLVSKWNRHKPSHENISKVAKYLGVDVEYLTGEKQEAPSNSEEDSVKKLYDFLVARGHVKPGESIPQEKLDIILSTLDNFIKLMDK